jgi:hypothetical protein
VSTLHTPSAGHKSNIVEMVDQQICIVPSKFWPSGTSLPLRNYPFSS